MLNSLMKLPDEGVVILVAVWNGDKSRPRITSLSITISKRPSLDGIGGSTLLDVSANDKHFRARFNQVFISNIVSSISY